MEPPKAAEVESKSEKPDETKANPQSYDCALYDTEVVYKIAQELLPGLASACVDNTTGGIFKNAGSVAADMRKEMADYLTQKSETYVAEFLLVEHASNLEISEHPLDIIINLIDDYATSKRNMFSRVSEWVSSDRREDRIEDFVQEMEINGFWLLARREHIAAMLLKNVDYKNAYHCNIVCISEEEVNAHRLECKFRPMDCTSEGCTTRYCAAQKERHELVCPFKILPCEQKCSDFVMRREMDRHCVTICPMKLVSCAFYTVGCDSSIPRCNVQQHNADNLSSHLLFIIRTAHKEANDEELKHRVEQIRKLSNIEKLARARDARALTYLIKDAEAKLGPLEAKSPKSPTNDKKESPIKTPEVKDAFDSPNKKEEAPANEAKTSTEKPVIPENDTSVPDPPVKIEENKDKKENESPPMKNEVSSDLQEKDSKEVVTKEKEQSGSPKKENIEEKETTREKVEETSSNIVGEESMKSTQKETSRDPASSDEQDKKKSPEKETVKESFRGDEEKSPKKETVKESSVKPPEKETTDKSSRRDEQDSSPQTDDSSDEEMKTPS